MDRISDEMLAKLMRGYEVAPPEDDLLERTRTMMHRHLAARREELAIEAPAAAKSNTSFGLVVSVTVLSVLVCFSLFYAATVGTVLKLVLPSTVDVYLTQSLIGVSIGGVALVIGMVLTTFFKVYVSQRQHATAMLGQ